MIELIEVNALNENFETHCRKGECFVEALLHALEDTPRVDAVPVVRCMDCQELDTDTRLISLGEEYHLCKLTKWWRRADDYCSSARKIKRR